MKCEKSLQEYGFKIPDNSNPAEALISVIIPVYNGEKFIEDTVRNILKVTYHNIEVLLVNDGSTDGSAEICKHLVELDGRVKYFYKENGGIASARNFGIENAEGDYIAFSDQDDLCKTNIYEHLLNDLEANNCEFVISNYSTFTDRASEFTCHDLIRESRIVRGGDKKKLQKYLLFHSMMYEPDPKFMIPEMVWNCLFSSAFLKDNKIEFCRYVDYEDDWLFLLQCLQCAESIYLEHESFYLWRLHEQSESHRSQKYIEDVYPKLVALTDYLYSYVQNAGFLQEEIDDYLSFRGARNIVYACMQEIQAITDWRSYMSAKRFCKNIVKKEKQRITNKKIYREYGSYYGKRLQIYLNLLRFKLVLPAFILDRAKLFFQIKNMQ